MRIILALIFLCPSLVFADLAGSVSYEDQITITQPAGTLNQEHEDVSTDEFVDVTWPVDVKEEDLDYLITLVLSEDDLPSKVTIDILENQIKVSLDNKIKFIKIPQDVDSTKIVHRVIEDKIKFTLPKKKLKSII